MTRIRCGAPPRLRAALSIESRGQALAVLRLLPRSYEAVLTASARSVGNRNQPTLSNLQLARCRRREHSCQDKMIYLLLVRIGHCRKSQPLDVGRTQNGNRKLV